MGWAVLAAGILRSQDRTRPNFPFLPKLGSFLATKQEVIGEQVERIY